MRNFKAISIALVLVLGVGCKKKKKDDPGPGTAMGTAGDMAGTGAGTDMAAAPDAAEPEAPKKELVNLAAADLTWEAMMPDAKDGPMMAKLWGDPMTEANGWLIKLKGGTPGSHHTHSGAYHGVSLAGAPSHFMDGQKKGTPLAAPAYWHMPGGVPHTSQCLGKEECIALVHFNDGKSDFAPAEFKKDGKPDAGYKEIVAKDMKFAKLDPNAPDDQIPWVAPAWGDMQAGPSGSFIKLKAGFTSPPHTHTADYHAVVIKGTLLNYKPDDKAPKEMGPGSYFYQPGGVDHITACKAGAECLGYVYFIDKFDFAMSDAGAGAGAGTGAN